MEENKNLDKEIDLKITAVITVPVEVTTKEVFDKLEYFVEKMQGWEMKKELVEINCGL